jgi:membrane-associated phospholipid phosphatase
MRRGRIGKLENNRSHGAVVLILGVIVLSGCASAKRDLEAGDYWPSGARWKRATMNALTSRGTWVPLLGAGVVSIDDWDQEISDWAVENTPVFGSTEKAVDASDDLKSLTTFAMVGTALAVPNGDGAWEWKPERLLLEFGAVELNNLVTNGLKSATARERPDGSDNRSFPSGHSSQAWTRTTLACRNVDQIPSLSHGWRVTLKTSFRVIAAGTSWARVEGGKHYPSDVLFGAALGNFVAIFVHDAFLPADSKTRFSATLSRKEAFFSVTFAF